MMTPKLQALTGLVVFLGAGTALAAEQLVFSAYREKGGKGDSIGGTADYDTKYEAETGGCVRNIGEDTIWSVTNGVTTDGRDATPLEERQYCVYTFGDHDCVCVGDMYPVSGKADAGKTIDLKASALSVYYLNALSGETAVPVRHYVGS